MEGISWLILLLLFLVIILVTDFNMLILAESAFHLQLGPLLRENLDSCWR